MTWFDLRLRGLPFLHLSAVLGVVLATADHIPHVKGPPVLTTGIVYNSGTFSLKGKKRKMKEVVSDIHFFVFFVFFAAGLTSALSYPGKDKFIKK